MALEKPETEDLRKVHAEINQLVNQRFLLTTAAISVFGVVLGLAIAKGTDLAVGVFQLTAVDFLLALIALMFLCSLLLKDQIRVLSTYLIVTGASNWEDHWKLFRESGGYFGYTKTQAILFLVLGILAAGVPITLVGVWTRPFPWRAVLTTGLLLFAYIVFVAGTGFGGWLDREEAIRKRWERLNK